MSDVRNRVTPTLKVAYQRVHVRSTNFQRGLRVIKLRHGVDFTSDFRIRGNFIVADPFEASGVDDAAFELGGSSPSSVIRMIGMSDEKWSIEGARIALGVRRGQEVPL